MDVRRGPWTEEEDMLLASYVSAHGEGRWNDLARAAGLKRTGKSCRLRWLNYLRPDVRRGNFTAEEQLLILQLHSRFGNRWSKIAELLPGRTDNEIKNYWRTRVQKHARALRCDPNSRQFLELINDLWVPHLLQKIHHAAAATAAAAEPPAAEGSSVVVPDVGNSPGSTSLSATPQSSPLPDVPDGSHGSSWSFLDDAGSAAEVGASLTCDDQGWPELDQIVWEGGDDFGDCWDMSFEQDLWCTIGN